MATFWEYNSTLMLKDRRNLITFLGHRIKCQVYLIAKLHNEVGHLGDLWFQHQITDAEYCLRIQELDQRIADLQG